MHNAYSIVFIFFAAVFWLAGLLACLLYLKRFKNYKDVCRPYEKIRDNYILHTRETEKARYRNAYQQILTNCGKKDCSEYELAQYLAEQETEARAKGQELSIIGRRLSHIVSMVHEKNAAPLMPDLETLSHLTRNRERTRPEFAAIGISASALLVIGLCGTLWCISDELQHSGENLLPVLANSLWPSMISVAGYVILIICRGVLSARFETALMRLNNLTLSLFEPVFQPLTHMGQAQQEFETMLSERQITPQQLFHSMEQAWRGNALPEVFGNMHGMVQFYRSSIAEYLQALPDVQNILRQLYYLQKRQIYFNKRLAQYRAAVVSLLQNNTVRLAGFSAVISQLSTAVTKLHDMVPVDIRGAEAVARLETNALLSLQRIRNLHSVCNELHELINSFAQTTSTLETHITRLQEVRHRRVDIETDMQAQLAELAQIAGRLSATADKCRQSMVQAQQQAAPFLQESEETLKTVRWEQERTGMLAEQQSQQLEPNFRQLRSEWKHFAKRINRDVSAPSSRSGCLGLILESVLSLGFAVTVGTTIAIVGLSSWWWGDSEPEGATPTQTETPKGAKVHRRTSAPGKKQTSSSLYTQGEIKERR